MKINIYLDKFSKVDIMLLDRISMDNRQEQKP